MSAVKGSWKTLQQNWGGMHWWQKASWVIGFLPLFAVLIVAHLASERAVKSTEVQLSDE